MLEQASMLFHLARWCDADDLQLTEALNPRGHL
jgi:hypothetical protein